VLRWQHATCLKQRCWENVSGKRDSGFEAISRWPTERLGGIGLAGGGGRWVCCLHHSNDKH